MPKAPRWLPRLVLDAAHLEQIRAHGGLRGIRDEGALEAALARARQRWHDRPKSTWPELVAADGFGVTTSHPYRDGNKRAGFLAMAILAGLNGHEIEATDAEVVTLMVGLAAGHVSEPDLAGWLSAHLVRSR